MFVQDRYVFKELKIKLILLNLKHGAQRSHSEACSLKNAHYPIFICFQMSCVVFWNQKRVVRKKV